MDILELLGRDGVFLRGGASSKRQVLHLIASLAAGRTGLTEDEILDALTTREALGSTGLGGSVAVPHARLPGLDRIAGLFVRLDSAVAWDALDDRPVDLIFALFAPPQQGAEHLRALAAVSRALRSPGLREAIRQARGVDGVHALLVASAGAEAA